MNSKEKIIYYPYFLAKPIIVNERTIKQVDISSHCDKHLEHGVSQELIIKFVKLLADNKGGFEADGQDGNKLYFKAYFSTGNRNYKLVWWWWLNKDDYILRVRTCYPI